MLAAIVVAVVEVNCTVEVPGVKVPLTVNAVPEPERVTVFAPGSKVPWIFRAGVLTVPPGVKIFPG